MNSYKLLQSKMTEIEKSKQKKNPSSQGSTVKKTTSETKSSQNLQKGKDENFTKTTSSQNFQKGKEANITSTKPQDPNVPDHMYGDYYCSICDSHMNSDGMWEAHITGKRHLKNIKKSDPDTKYDELNEESSILYEIRNVKDAVVGLSYIQEIRRKEAGAPPLFTCYLCQATLANAAMLIEHVINMKHRLNYIKERSPGDYSLLTATKLKKGQMEPLVTELAEKLEDKFGRGSVKVKKEKNKPDTPYKHYNISSDEDDTSRPSKRQKFTGGSFLRTVPKNNFKEVRDCREIIEEKRRHMYTSDEDTNDVYYRSDSVKKSVYSRHSNRSESPPPRSQKPYSCSPPREFKKVSHDPTYIPSHDPTYIPSHDSTYISRSSAVDPSYSSLPLPQKFDISYDATHFPRSPAVDLSHSRSNRLPEMGPVNVNPSRQPKAAEEAMYTIFQTVYDLPVPLMLKLLILKMSKFEGKDKEEWSLITKNTEAYLALYKKKKPSDLEDEILREILNHSKTKSNPQDSPVIMESKTENEYEQQSYDFINKIINKAKVNKHLSPPVYQKETTYQSAVPEINTDNASKFGFNDYLNQANNYLSPSSSAYGRNEMSYQTQQNPLYGSSSYGNTGYTENTGNNMPTTSNSYSYSMSSSNVDSQIPGLNYTKEPEPVQASYQPPYYDSSPHSKYTHYKNIKNV